ncbi:hypothetical protein PR048_023836 [Dryococelus australis]|uniref:Uncharacterized protein n=1 Tax=Dryococelus australis TaxID=614101 RepID=A0ABQ9GVA0_9NEOP|nr:hypothetical protein PR048_023836 [Dryococelus australis]
MLTSWQNYYVNKTNFICRYIPGSGDLPKAATLRTDIVPRVGKTTEEEIKEAVKDKKKIAVVADETTDICGTCVFAVLFRTVTASSAKNVYLASCSFLSKANSTTCSQAILDTVNKFDISLDNVTLLITWALNLAGDCFLKESEELNMLVAKMKSAFLFPVPVVTRWNSWFNSILYLAQYVVGSLKFFSNECEFINNSIEYIDSNAAFLLKVQIKFVSEICVKIKVLITDLESSDYSYGHKLQDELDTLQNSLQRCADGSFPHGIIQLLNQCSNAVVKEDVKGILKSCMQILS